MFSTNDPLWILLPTCFGFLIVIKHFIIFLKWVFIVFLRPPKNLKNYGSWALVTGATDGIGKAFTHQLAQKGLNLILVSRSIEKLKSVSNEIHQAFPQIHIKIIPLDFSGDISGGIRDIEEAIRDIDVGILINNVGITYPKAQFFHQTDDNMWMKIVKVNLQATTWITKTVLPAMIRRKKGAIVNIGSGAGVVVPSHPLFTIYAATKAYIDQLSRCLHMEYKSYGIDVQCQVPLYVATNMASKVASITRSSIFVPLPNDYARAAINRIGFEPRCTPFWAHSVQWFFVRFLPEKFLDAWRLSIGIRRRGEGNS